MSENYFDRQRAAITQLTDAIRARAAAEAELTTAYEAAAERAEREANRARKSNAAARESELGRIDEDHNSRAAANERRFDAEQYAADRSRDDRRTQTTERYKSAEKRGRTEHADRLWHIDSMLEAGEKAAKEQLESLQRKAFAGSERVTTLWAEAEPLLARGRVTQGEVEFTGELPPRASRGKIRPEPRVRFQRGDSPRELSLALRQVIVDEVLKPAARAAVDLVDHFRQPADPLAGAFDLLLRVLEPCLRAAKTPLLDRCVRIATIPGLELALRQLGLGTDHVLLAVSNGLLPEGELLIEPFEGAANLHLHTGERLGEAISVVGEGRVPVANCLDGADIGLGPGHQVLMSSGFTFIAT